MTSKAIFNSILIISLTAIILDSCKKEEEAPPAPTQFVANDKTFKGYEDWKFLGTVAGKDPALSGFHGGGEISSFRHRYIKDDADTAKGDQYPKGTLLVKETVWDGGEEYTAMAKRGLKFNPDGNDWEWFILNKDGTIKKDSTGKQLRGKDLSNGLCSGCHFNAKVDFVFSKHN